MAKKTKREKIIAEQRRTTAIDPSFRALTNQTDQMQNSGPSTYAYTIPPKNIPARPTTSIDNSYLQKDLQKTIILSLIALAFEYGCSVYLLQKPF